VYLQQNFAFERVELNVLIQFHDKRTKKRRHAAGSTATATSAAAASADRPAKKKKEVFNSF
jgi:hypothetical protein